MKNRCKRARERAGLSVDQAAKILGITTDGLLLIEEDDSCYAIADRANIDSIYAVNVDWLGGDAELHDYASIEKIRGADRLTFHDRDVLAEFAASLPRKPAKTIACLPRDKVPAGEENALCYECGVQLTVDDRELALCNACEERRVK